jgi:hypothetical protein
MIESGRPLFQFTLRTLLLFVVLGSSLGVFGAWGMLAFAVVVGLAVYIHQVKSLWSLAYLVLAVLCLMCVLGLPLTINAAREAAYRASCLNRMHQLGLALRNYHEANKSFPPACTTGKSGKPLHSWRTLILPFLEYGFLYNSIDHAQSWDSPKNTSTLAIQPKEFVCASDPTSNWPGATQADYFAVVGPNTAWDRSRLFAPSDKEASHTIMLVEVAESGIAWAEPRDFSLDALAVVDAEGDAHPISSNHYPPGEFFYTYGPVAGGIVALADGSVGLLRTDNLSPEELRKILQVGGYTSEVINSRGSLYVNHRLNWPNIAALAVWLVAVSMLLAAAVRSRKLRFVPLLADSAPDLAK